MANISEAGRGAGMLGKARAHLRNGTLLSTLVRRLRWVFGSNPARFLRNATGVIHVGANSGQERDVYRLHGLRVLWLEPIPELFEQLSKNIQSIPEQRAIQCLITDKDDAEYSFHVASNDGGSSSIFDLGKHREIWPNVRFERTILLKSRTLASLVVGEGLTAEDYDVLVMDTQGSELLVLEGAEPLLRHFKYIRTEVADFEAYVGCCQLPDLDSFMSTNGYREVSRVRFAGREGVGNYYDVLYKRVAAPR